MLNTPLNSKDVIVLYLLVAKKAWKREGLKFESIEARWYMLHHSKVIKHKNMAMLNWISQKSETTKDITLYMDVGKLEEKNQN